MKNFRDRELGMHRRIPRRDFLNGVALALGAAIAPRDIFPGLLASGEPEKDPGYYPPALTGLRGSHAGSFEVAHSLQDKDFFRKAGAPRNTGEAYDLVVVGGGISGLSAAHFFRKARGDKSRILILENHDDFGGHAKRNEFQASGRTLLGYGGTFSIESPAPYSAVAKGLIEELGIDVSRWSQVVDPAIYSSRGLKRGIFLDRETFGADHLAIDPLPGWKQDAETMDLSEPDTQAFMIAAPLSAAAKADLVRLLRDKKDFFPGVSSAEKKARLARISYADFLVKVAGAGQELAAFFNAVPEPLYGVGIDAVSAQDAWGLGLPGFQGLGLDPSPGPGMNYDAIRNEAAEKYFFHFPDGGASIARLLVRRLIPAAIPGSTADDVVTAKARYARLDEAGSPVRIRLNSTVVRVRHLGSAANATHVEVTYSRGGKLHTVQTANCILACWNFVIPYIFPELPQAQKDALSFGVKLPLVYTNVLLRNWTSFAKLGVYSIYSPGSYHPHVNLDLPVSMGGYRCPHSPDEPIVVHMMRTPNRPGLPAREQHRAGRGELLATPFTVFERKIREQLARTLSGGGFDPARDIAAITVNRWPHGYAYQYNSLFDAFWLEGGEQPCVVGRKPHGRVAIANADAAAYSYLDASIDQAFRAVQEVAARG